MNRNSQQIVIVHLARYLHDISKFLIIKKPVCEKLIEFNNTIIPNGGDRHSKKFKEMYKKVLSTRETIVSEIHLFNKKGHQKSS